MVPMFRSIDRLTDADAWRETVIDNQRHLAQAGGLEALESAGYTRNERPGGALGSWAQG